jgi:PPOX class probable F420-dependent enzyme
VSRRDQITMSAAERAAFLDEQRTVVCATIGARGWPHLMPLWYVMRGEEMWAWTYGKSQKVRNLERDPRATLQVQDGTGYDQLRGVMIEARAQIHSDLDVVVALATQLFTRYAAGSSSADMEAAIRAQAPKRVALQFVAEKTVSWDHRKLAGSY